MAITLPIASAANTSTNANLADQTVVAQNAFIANVTVLINNAIKNNIFCVEPYCVPLVSTAFVTAYFTALGYTVLFPIVPTYPYNPTFVPGFPEVLPPGYVTPFSNPYAGEGPPRFRISWSSAIQDVLLLENGEFFQLEDGVDYLLLEV